MNEGGRGTLTFASHARLETLLQAAVLALVAVVDVDGAVAVAATRVRQVASHGALEEALAAFARVLSVVLATALVATHCALNVLRFAVGVRTIGRVVIVCTVLHRADCVDGWRLRRRLV